MASGILAAVTLVAATPTDVYEQIAGTNTVTVNACNTTALQCALRLSVFKAGGSSKYIEYNLLLPSTGVMERGGIVLAVGDKIIAYSNQAIDITVWGYGE